MRGVGASRNLIPSIISKFLQRPYALYKCMRYWEYEILYYVDIIPVDSCSSGPKCENSASRRWHLWWSNNSNFLYLTVGRSAQNGSIRIRWLERGAIGLCQNIWGGHLKVEFPHCFKPPLYIHKNASDGHFRVFNGASCLFSLHNPELRRTTISYSRAYMRENTVCFIF